MAPAFDASNRYVRMPTIRATNAPSTIGTWYVGVCESSRHDWLSPVPDFARVASMVLSPPERHPPMPGHSRIGTIFEPRVPRDKHDVAPPLTIGFSHPRVGRHLHHGFLRGWQFARYRTEGDNCSAHGRFPTARASPLDHQRHQGREACAWTPQRGDFRRAPTRRFRHPRRVLRNGSRMGFFVRVPKGQLEGFDHRLRAAQIEHELVTMEQDSNHLLAGDRESLDRVGELDLSTPPRPRAREGLEDLVAEDVDRHDRVVAPGRLRLLDGGRDPQDAGFEVVALDDAVVPGIRNLSQQDCR